MKKFFSFNSLQKRLITVLGLLIVCYIQCIQSVVNVPVRKLAYNYVVDMMIDGQNATAVVSEL